MARVNDLLSLLAISDSFSVSYFAVFPETSKDIEGKYKGLLSFFYSSDSDRKPNV